jgi:RNA 2',3'-cyclic 3'-phosphodiesterase
METIEESSAIGKQTARVFFAIWPDHKTQKQLGGLIEQLKLEALCGGRKTKSQNIHLTLVFLGEVDTHRLTALHHVADEIRDSGARAFDFSIEEIGYWKHNQIIYLAPREVPAELFHLVSRLKNGVSAAGFAVEQRPYAPHLTLMRNARCRAVPELPEPITWQARDWLLVKSEQTSGGSAYAPVGRWSLE